MYFNEYKYKGNTSTAIQNCEQKKLKKTTDDFLNDLISKLLKKDLN